MTNIIRDVPHATTAERNQRDPRQQPIYSRPKTKPKPATPKDRALHEWCEARALVELRLTDGTTLAGTITAIEMFAIEITVGARRIFIFKHAMRPTRLARFFPRDDGKGDDVMLIGNGVRETTTVKLSDN